MLIRSVWAWFHKIRIGSLYLSFDYFACICCIKAFFGPYNNINHVAVGCIFRITVEKIRKMFSFNLLNKNIFLNALFTKCTYLFLIL